MPRKRRRRSSNSPEKPPKKMPRVADDEDSHVDDSETRSNRIEQYEEGMDVDSQGSEHKERDNTDESANLDILTVGIDERKLRIYLDGVWDMTHYGHFRLFKQVKDHFPNACIIVGVAGDEETCKLKGQTVLNEEERAESIGHCKWVDEVICPCPWIVTQEFLNENRIQYVAHDAALYVSAGSDDIYAFVKAQGRFIATQRTDGVSTTGMINRIVRRYNEYILRNLHRGVSREDLNLSWTRMQRIKAGESMRKNAEYMQSNLRQLIQDPDEFISGFLAMFGPGGRIRNKISEKIVEMREEFVEYAQYAPM